MVYYLPSQFITHQQYNTSLPIGRKKEHYIYKKLGPIKGLRGKENYLKGEFICEYEFIFLIGKTNEQKDEFQRIVV